MPFNLEKEGLKGIFEQASDGILIVDRYLRLIGLNQAAEVITGWNAAEIVDQMMLGDLLYCTDSNGTRLEEFSLPPPDLAPKNASWTRELEITIYRKDGLHVWVPGVFIFASLSEGNQEGAPYGYVLMRDIGKKVLEGELIERDRIDPISGLYTRSFFDELYEKEIRRAVRHGGYLGAVIVELQNLEKIMDTGTARGGEDVLGKVARLVRSTTREIDTVARYKGNEFVVLLLESDLSRTNLIEQRIRDRLKAFNTEMQLMPPLKYRIGTAVADQDYGSLLKRARETLKER